MEQVIVAFESEKTCQRIRDVLERSGTAACLLCRSGDQVRRLVNERRISVVICGYKLAEESAADVLSDLPCLCSMVLLARQDQLDLVRGERLFPLPAPAPRRALLELVEELLRRGRETWEGASCCRTGEDRELIARAKELLMKRYGLTEDGAHRLLRKKSMDHREKLVQTACEVLGIKRDA